MTKARRTCLAFALAPLALFASGTAKADDPAAGAPSLLPAASDPLVWVENCPFDFRHPRQMRCLSRSLVPQSYAVARAQARAARALGAPPDAGEGVDASADIGTCNGVAGGGGGGTATGWAPADYVKAYDIPASPTGSGKIVAIVDACAESTIATDLAAYRAHYSLPALPGCGADGGVDGYAPTPGGTPCFGVVSQRGDGNLPPPDSDWAGEIALDVDMVSAACPDCSILLIEADSPNSWDLGPAVNEAVALGAAAVSNSYGAPEDPSDAFGPLYSDGPYAAYYDHAGVLIAVASGDGNYNNQDTQGATTAVPSFPSTVPAVLSVGGTSLVSGGGPSTVRGGFTENVWNDFFGGTTSGCSTEFATPAYQSGLTASCAMRADVDVSASAEDVATVLHGGWVPESGTSCASPFVAGLFARLGIANQANAYFYARGADFYDVTTGNNDPSGACTDVMCTAGVGWDGPTGWGSPNAAALAGEDAGVPLDDAGTDAGETLDAGVHDAGHPTDAGHEFDGGGDGGHEHDGGHIHDGGFGHDATVDGGGADDAAASDDANGSGSSSGGSSGGGSGGSSSGGGTDDSGLVAPGGDAATGDEEGNGDNGSSNGCGCTTVGSSSGPEVPAGLALVAGLAVFAARRRRRAPPSSS